MKGEQYTAILTAIADKLIEKDREIALLKYEVKSLTERLDDAEKYAIHLEEQIPIKKQSERMNNQ